MNAITTTNEADRTAGRFANAMEEPCAMSEAVRGADPAGYYLQ